MTAASATRAAAIFVALAVAFVVATAGATGSSREAGGRPQPRVIQLHYADVRDGTFPRYRLSAFARRTDSVKLSTRFSGKRATADTRYDDDITDTDINGQNAKHPFVLIRKHGGRRVLRLIRDSLNERGEARVRVRARRDGRVDAIKVRIVLAKCAQDPPFYPVDCEVRRSGKHV